MVRHHLKQGFVFLLFGFLLLGVSHRAGALNADYNRPNPLLDYVPQDLGVYDSRYDALTEQDCRACHGEDTVARHHYSPMGLLGLCGPCHDSDGFTIIRDCTASGCHSWDDVLTGNGWHHDTDLSHPDNCIRCHNPNLVGPIGDFVPFSVYPPAVVTPTPWSCENCHWEQVIVESEWTEGNPAPPTEEAGHPSTYDHYDQQGTSVGYHEYGRDIAGNYDTHHMGFKGFLTYACDWCHSRDPNDPLWDPYDPELIRYCTTCHNEASIHTIDTHYNVGYVDPVIANGWDALGFHAGGSGSIPISYDSYTANEMCWGCHSDWGDVQDPLHLPYIHLNPQGISPAAVQAPSFVELRGGNFGDTQETGRAVQLKSRSGSMDWTDMPIQLWSDDYITLEIPCGTLDRGNYWVRVQTEEGVSNQVGFTFIDNGCGCGCLRPAALPCTGRITLQHPSGGYGMSQDVISAPGAADGQYKIVDLVSSQGTFTALAIVKWQSDKIKIKVADFFQDLEPRNYLQDVGEPTLSACDAIDPDTFSVYVRYITYSDDDQTGNFSAGDALLQVESDLPYPFALTEDLYIAKTKPRQCTNRSRLVLKGIHFGDTQEDGVVRIGRKLDAQDPSLGKGALLDRVKQWHTDKVVVQLKVKSGWEGKNRFVWIEKNGVKSNYQKVRILPPLP